MTEPTAYDRHLGFRTVCTLVVLVTFAVFGHWWAVWAVILMLVIWKRASAAEPGDGGCSECQQAADERLREFTKDWTEPEQRDVEDIIAERGA